MGLRIKILLLDETRSQIDHTVQEGEQDWYPKPKFNALTKIIVQKPHKTKKRQGEGRESKTSVLRRRCLWMALGLLPYFCSHRKCISHMQKANENLLLAERNIRRKENGSFD